MIVVLALLLVLAPLGLSGPTSEASSGALAADLESDPVVSLAAPVVSSAASTNPEDASAAPVQGSAVPVYAAVVPAGAERRSSGISEALAVQVLAPAVQVVTPSPLVMKAVSVLEAPKRIPSGLSKHHGHLHTHMQPQDMPEERSLSIVSIGWVVAGAMVVFAFVNTILLGSTIFITVALFQWLFAAMKIVAPSIALAFGTAFTTYVRPLVEGVAAVVG